MFTKRRLMTLFSLSLLILAVFALEEALGCPNCSKAVAENDAGNGGNVGAGFTYSIYLMMVVPYTVMGGLGYICYGLYKQSLVAMEEAEKAYLEAQQQAKAGEPEELS